MIEPHEFQVKFIDSCEESTLVEHDSMLRSLTGEVEQSKPLSHSFLGFTDSVSDGISKADICGEVEYLVLDELNQ